MDRPIRVAQIIGRIVHGGIESVVTNYYRYIDKENMQFDFFVEEDSPFDAPDEWAELGGHIYVVPSSKHLFKYLQTLIKLFGEHKYKIVHAHWNAMSVFPLFAARCAGVPVRIAHSHSTASRGETGKNILKYALRPFSKVFATNYAACSRYAGEWLFGKRAMEEGKVTIFNNAIELDKFKYDENIRNEVRRELGIEGKFVIGHVGRLCYQKNQSFLIDIFEEVYRRNPDAVLLLIGDGEDEPMIEEKAKQLTCGGSVLILGNRADVARLYQAMDVLALPSRYEGLPIVAVEAQAAGLPCILSDRITTEIRITNHVRFISLEEGSAKWAEALLAPEKTGRGNECDLSQYDIRQQVKKLTRYYIDLCNYSEASEI